ncbi:MAG: class I SAM-dependent methyltransferase [Dehalococcoidia bacterium]|nr:class I SAM-dependent methyltransferase [Dehalococcoidia bacterium]MCB9485527.1 class I SAM-dependent methyltransferase [Thermoflexaceae bacterium]
MAQNIYDDPAFFQAYSRLPRSKGGLDAAPEWPSLRALLPALNGLRVLDLGCGYGWFCRWALASGATEVTGVDLSARMLDRARDMTPEPGITYVQADLESFGLRDASVDLVYSSLAFHYVEDLQGLFRRAAAWLTPGASFVFSVEHPIYTAPRAPGWAIVDGREVWPLDRYLQEGVRTTNWLADGVVKQHRTIGTYVRLLREAGFTLLAIDEWGPGETQIQHNPDWARERDRPMFLLIAARRDA